MAESKILADVLQMQDSGAETLPEGLLRQLRQLLTEGRYLDALALADASGDWREWRGTRARIVASRLASNLGATRWAALRSLQAFRADRRDGEAFFYAAGTIAQSQGAWTALRFIARHSDQIVSTTETLADLLALRGRLHATMRDFKQAMSLLDEADRIHPDDPWVHAERAFALQLADRYEDALKTARHALILQPNYRPAVQVASHLLHLLERDDEAEALLRAAAATLQSGAVWAKLAELCQTRGDHVQALTGWERAREHYVLAEPAVKSWLAGVTARSAYLTGDRERARREAVAAGGYYYEKMAERLATAGQPRRLLEVKFQRQHHMTCAPACLAMVSDWFGRPMAQQEIAEEICYDGTPDHQERAWLERTGWIAREFSLTWDVAKALLDRGIPFILQTQETNSAHVQVVVGYDVDLGLFLVRDPYVKPITEFLADELLEHYKNRGPRCLVLVPGDQGPRLDGIVLPDMDQYDRRYQIRRALAAHDRAAAASALAEAIATASEHWLTLVMRLDLAFYDRAQSEILDLTDRLYALNHHDLRYLHLRMATLRDSARQEERLRLLQELTKARDCDPIFMLQLAEEWRADRRQHETAFFLVDRARRRSPGEARVYWNLGELFRNQGQARDARQAYRAAACLQDKNEFYAQSFAAADADVDGSAREALDFLRERFQKYHQQSGACGRTLHQALQRHGQEDEARVVLERAVAAQPEDGELLVYAAHAFAREGRAAEARQLLDRAEGRVSALDHLEARATLADLAGDDQAALSLWLELCAKDPANMDARRQAVRLLARGGGRPKAIAWLRESIAGQPANRHLRQLLVEWLRDTDSPELEAALSGLIDVWPHDPRAYRELAMYHAGHNRFAEAETELAKARSMAPDALEQLHAEAYVARRQGHLDRAREGYLRAIDLEPDDAFAFRQALAITDGEAARAEVINAYYRGQTGPTTRGEGLAEWQQIASEELDSTQVDDMLTELIRHRPAWLPAHLALLNHALTRPATAADPVQAISALRQFPSDHNVRLAAARLMAHAGDTSAAEAALTEGIRAAPTHRGMVCELSKIYELANQPEKERELLNRTLAGAASDGVLWGYLADSCWRCGDRDAAIEAAKRAVTIQPDYDWAWDKMTEWLQETGDSEALIRCLYELLERRPGDPRLWTRLAIRRHEMAQPEEALAACAKALAADPEHRSALQLKVRILEETGATAEVVTEITGSTLPLAAHLSWAATVGKRLLEAGQAAEAGQLAAFIIAKEPHHYEGLCLQVDALEQLDKKAESLRVSQELTRHYPTSAIAWGYLAHAQRQSGDPAAARATFDRAMMLDPDYEFAATSHFDLSVEAGALVDAGRSLEVLRACAPDRPYTLIRSLTWHRQSGKPDEAVADLIALMRLPDAKQSAARGQTMIAEAGWLERLAARLGAEAQSDSATPSLAAAFVRAQVDSNQVGSAVAYVSACRAAGEARENLYQKSLPALLTALAEKREKDAFLRSLALFRADARQDDGIWAAVGSAHQTLGLWKEAINWYEGWQARQPAPWVLFNIATCLRAGDQLDTADGINLDVVARRAKDHTWGAHQVTAALVLARRGQVAQADELLRQGLEDPQIDNLDRYVGGLARIIIDFMQNMTRTGQAGLRGALRVIRLFRRFDRTNRSMAKTTSYGPVRRQCLRTIGDHTGPGGRALVRLYQMLFG